MCDIERHVKPSFHNSLSVTTLFIAESFCKNGFTSSMPTYELQHILPTYHIGYINLIYFSRHFHKLYKKVAKIKSFVMLFKNYETILLFVC